jgi:sugar phosphate isomerase/epimerase
MRLAVSNIAWSPGHAPAAYGLMRRHGATGLEIAPRLAFPGEDDPFRPSASALAALRAELAAFGLRAVSMQALLFGLPGAQLFGSAEQVAAFERAIERAIDLAGTLDIANLVLGAPRNRAYPEALTAADANARAAALLRRLGDRALAAGARLAVEPTPAAYGTNFLNTVAQAAAFVAALDHPGVTLNFDLGALYQNAEADRAETLYDLAGGRVSHVHVSEPDLAAAPADPGRLTAIAGSLLARGYEGWFSIEMRETPDGGLGALERALRDTAGALAAARRAAGEGTDA